MNNDTSFDIIQESNPVQTVAQPKEDNEMLRATDRITALYCRLSVEDTKEDKKNSKEDLSNSIQNQELLCRGWFLQPNTYDCGSFVVNGTAVVGKEPKKPYNRCKSTQKGAELYEIYL